MAARRSTPSAGAYLDDPQLELLQRGGRSSCSPGDRIILCTPNPSWVEAVEKPSLYDTIDYFLRKVIAPTGADVMLMLSGDLHHYARYSQDPAAAAHHLRRRRAPTCTPTHELPKKIDGAAEGVASSGTPATPRSTTWPRAYPAPAALARRWPPACSPGCRVRNSGFLILLGDPAHAADAGAGQLPATQVLTTARAS